MLHLPKVPSHITPLRDSDARALRQMDATLPRNPSQCITCDGTLTFRWWADARSKSDAADWACDCRGQYLLHLWLTYCGLGKRYQRYGWDDAVGVPEAAERKVLAYADTLSYALQTGNGLTLAGEMTGTGKTLLAALLLKRIVDMGHDAYFVTFADMMAAKYDTFGHDRETRTFFESRIANAGFLVLDDMGRESNALKVEPVIDALLRRRVANCKPTIVTTNVGVEAVKQRYSSNVVSLFSEVNETVLFEGGTDFRARANSAMASETAAGLRRPVVLG